MKTQQRKYFFHLLQAVVASQENHGPHLDSFCSTYRLNLCRSGIFAVFLLEMVAPGAFRQDIVSFIQDFH